MEKMFMRGAMVVAISLVSSAFGMDRTVYNYTDEIIQLNPYSCYSTQYLQDIPKKIGDVPGSATYPVSDRGQVGHQGTSGCNTIKINISENDYAFNTWSWTHGAFRQYVTGRIEAVDSQPQGICWTENDPNGGDLTIKPC